MAVRLLTPQRIGDGFDGRGEVTACVLCYRIPGVAGCGPTQPRMKQPGGQFANGADMGLPRQDSGLQPG